jgi:hypothetical protein
MEECLNTVIMDLKGGLGNQMFQYAAGRALAERVGARLVLNVWPFLSDPLREYGLDAFRVAEERIAVPTPRVRRWQRILGRVWPVDFQRIVVRDPHFH